MIDSEKRLANLSPEKRALLSKLLRDKRAAAQVESIPRRADRGASALSFAQQRLWFLDQMAPGNSFYTIAAAIQLKGLLDFDAVQQSLNTIVQRHEALRSTFRVEHDHPVQVVEPEQVVYVQQIDLQTVPAAARENAIQQLAAKEAHQPFDLAHGPLLRAGLLKVSATEHILLLTVHHIVADGWSMGVLLQEFTTFYAAFAAGQPVALPDLPIQYADFAQWQRQWLHTSDATTGMSPYQTQLDYWQERLTGSNNLLELPTDRPRPPQQTYNGAHHAFSLPGTVLEALRDLSQRENATLFMTLLAVFQVLLYRYSGQTDINVGASVANRNRVELEPLIGFFVNMLVLRTDLSGNPGFRDLLQRVRTVALGAYAHQDLPFEVLVEALQPERDMSHSPLFQVAFDLQRPALQGEVKLADIQARLLETETGIAKFDLMLLVEEQPDGLCATFEYNTDLFDAATIARMEGHFRTLLDGIIADPLQPIATLPLLTAAEREQLLVAWNATQTDYPNDHCIHWLFEAQVAHTPDAVALVFENQQLTYQELNRRANQLAHYLQRLGIGPEVLVGISTERSIDMIVAVLGVWKAGGAYVPLDPTYPAERLAFMLADSQVALLLTQTQVDHAAWTEAATWGQQEATASHCPPIIYLDANWSVIAQETDDNPTSSATAENLAYVIYTSGSTGQPKGVLVAHHGLCNLAQAQIAKFDLTTHSQVLQFASFSFDACISEISTTLLAGATLHLVPRPILQDTTELVHILRKRKITTVTLPPSLLAVLAEEELPALQTVVSAGETCPWDVALRWCRGRRMLNAYGPTETTVGPTCYEVGKYVPGTTSVPIGRPIANMRIYLLDQHRQPVPVGVPGEVYVGGAGIARGYLNRPTLTTEKFIPDAFSRVSGSRLYQTGDLARYLPDGSLEFLGRRDHQIKLRGFRIELGEIEAIISQYAGVQAAVVLAREDIPGDKRLVAYIVPACEHRSLADEIVAAFRTGLQDFLKARLPAYMIPSAFLFLDAFPLSPNGKIDRRALPAPESTDFQQQNDYIAPRTLIEDVLAGIWAQVLGIERVGITANFFALGGHSLLATQLISRVRDAFNIEIPLRRMFEAADLASFATYVSEAVVQENDWLATPPIQSVSRDGDIPLSFAQERLWFLYQLEPDSPFYNISTALRLRGTLDHAALEHALNTMVQRQESLRTTFATIDGRPFQIIAPSLFATIPTIDLRLLPAEEREISLQRLAQEEARRPFNLEQGPLWRITLVQLDAHDQVLLVTFHHIISDGWSHGVIVRQFAALYQAYRTDQPAILPDTPIQYADFAAWQRQWLQGEVLETHLNYWKQQLAGSVPLLELPTDRPRPAIQSFQGATCAFTLSPELVGKLYALSQQQQATLFMTLLATFQVLLHRYSGQDDINVGTPIANRTRSEVENLIGCFTNTLVIRTLFSGDLSFRQLLQQVRETTLEAYMYQSLPFELVVDALQPERDLSHTPLFQVMFILQNVPTQAFELFGLDIDIIELDSGTSTFDITLAMEETAAGLKGLVEYNTDLFDAATIDRMIAHFQLLLEGVVADPDQPVARLPLLLPNERDLLLYEWNDTATSCELDQCIQHMIERQVAATPMAIAVRRDGTALCYAELNARANQLAHLLQQHGVGPDTLVALSLDRSLDLLVAILAVWKAGGAYLPLDPTHPTERLTAILADARPAMLLTRPSTTPQPSSGAPTLTVLDLDAAIYADYPATAPICAATAENLAYVIYTSGSTGQPKGVLVTHRNLVNAAYAWADAYQLPAMPQRHLQMANVTFDVFAGDLVRALCWGGTLVLCPRDALLMPADLAALIRQEQITCAEFVPAVLRSLLEYLAERNERLDSMHLLICGSDIWYSEEFSYCRQFCATTTRLINSFGLTETTIDSTFFEARTDQSPGAGVVPIGRPFANTRIYIVDSQGQPVPIGVPGEIWIGGAGVSRGYLHRAELTAAKFIDDPFVVQPGARVYKTGDRACYQADGTIVFLGRQDNQVKIRGHRIETGEIEAVLGQHPDVREAVVLAQQNKRGTHHLIAYVVTEHKAELKTQAVGESPPVSATPDNQSNRILASELRMFLQDRLPEYMLPAFFVPLNSIPLTPNGKVDRRALPVPDQACIEPDTTYVAPHTPVETTLAEIWQQVLGLERVSIHANFFELGGDSILSIQVIARANQAGLHLTPRHLFQMPTIAELATIVGTGPTIHAEQELVTGEIPLTPIQHWFFEQQFAQPHHWNQAVLLELRQPLDHSVLEATIQQLLAHHDALRLRFVCHSGEWQQFYAELEEQFQVERFDLSHVPADEQEAIIATTAAETQASLNMSEGPLMRVVYFDRGSEQTDRLLLVIHHLAIDGVSWRILLEDLHSVYQQLGSGLSVQLPPKTTSFQYWAQQLVEYAQSEQAYREEHYWLTILQQKLPDLPVDFRAGDNSEGAIDMVQVSLTGEETYALLHDVPATYGTTINDALLTALASAIAGWTRTRACLIELEGHGREPLFDNVDISRTVGWFTSTFPVCLDLNGVSGPGAALKAIKEQIRNIPDNGIGYGILRYLSNRTPILDQLHRLPQPEVAFNYLGQFDQTFSATSLFAPAHESSGPTQGPRNQRTVLLDVIGSIVGGVLRLEWVYSTNMHHRATIERLAQEFIASLRQIIAHCQSPDTGGYTPSDFNDIELSQEDIELLMNEISTDIGDD